MNASFAQISVSINSFKQANPYSGKSVIQRHFAQKKIVLFYLPSLILFSTTYFP